MISATTSSVTSATPLRSMHSGAETSMRTRKLACGAKRKQASVLDGGDEKLSRVIEKVIEILRSILTSLSVGCCRVIMGVVNRTGFAQ